MISIIIVVAIVTGVGYMAWRRWSSWCTLTAPLPSAEISSETLALEAFTHGNTCLAEGQFAQATAAFDRARALDPKRLYVAERLAEVAQRQSAALAMAPASASS
jgi:hypothetical protein